MINGSDCASYQGKRPPLAGLDFLFIKATQGLHYENPYWEDQLAEADAAGLVTGLYHYPDMRNGAAAELQRFLSVIGAKRGKRMLMLDWEGYDQENQTVSHADQAAYKDAWLALMPTEAPDNRSVLYANLDYWRNVDTTGRFGDALFIATVGLPAGRPGILTPWLFHQYGESNGVDLDVANFPSRAALAAWTNKQEVDVTPDELLNARMPAWAAVPGKDGQPYIPTVAEALHGSQTADTQIAALSHQVEQLQQTLAQPPAGGATAAELQAAAEAGAQAAINKFLASLTIKAA